MSKLQTNFATSTMEAEYTALSIALRAAIPLLEVIRFVISAFSLNTGSLLRFKTTLEPGRQTRRSNFFAIRYHWFRSYLKPNEIEIAYIDTSIQKADMLTKSLGTDLFERNRKAGDRRS
jgi:hypothetical protein